MHLQVADLLKYDRDSISMRHKIIMPDIRQLWLHKHVQMRYVIYMLLRLPTINRYACVEDTA